MNQAEQREEALFGAALQLSAGDRATYLEKACAGDANLRRHVEVLLNAFDRAGGFMKQPVSPERTVKFSLPPTEKPGDRIGRYKLLEQIGEGGCGVVYVADQEEPVRRRAALKVIKLGMDTKQVIARFDAERQALAMMDHPNIAKVFDAGATDTGRPYFVMELVRGIKITDYCDQYQLSPRARLELFIQVCRAIQHAHQKGIIHRDIKPSNILVTVNDGLAIPKVIDFGIAKATQGRLTDLTVYTAFEQFIGTPAYMSPEQTEMTSIDIDTRTDIYSLGVLLYELLTGKTPFDAKELLAAGLDEMRRTIREKQPVRPSTRLTQEPVARLAGSGKSEIRNPKSEIDKDLDCIVLKCLEKDRALRYETANGLASDIQRHLNNEPIVARPPSKLDRFQKLVRRNKLGFGAGAAVATAVLVSLVVLLISNLRIDTANRELRATVSLLELQRAEDLFQAEDSAAGTAHLAAILRHDPSNQIAASRLMSALLHGDWGLPAPITLRHDDKVVRACFSPDGRQVLTASFDNTARIWDWASGAVIGTMRHDDRVGFACYSPDGLRVVTACFDGTARVWNASNGAPVAPPLPHGGKVHWAEFSHDGRHVVTGAADRRARIWDASSGVLKKEYRLDSEVLLARFSPDDTLVASAEFSGSMRVWSRVSGAMRLQTEPEHGTIYSFAFSPDGRRIVAAHKDGVAALYDLRAPASEHKLLAHKAEVWHAEFSPDSRLVLTTSVDGTAQFWEAASGERVGQRLLHQGGVNFGQFSSDGKKAVTASMDNSVRVWDVENGRPSCQPLRESEQSYEARFSPDGKRLVIASVTGVAQVWDLRGRKSTGIETRFPKAVTSVAFSADGKSLAAASLDGTAILLEVKGGGMRSGPFKHEAPVTCVELSPDGLQLATASEDGTARIWDALTGRLLVGPFRHAKKIYTVHYNPDGSRIVTASVDGTARVWSARNGQPIASAMRHTNDVNEAHFSPDGKLIVTASDDFTARLWNAFNGEPVTPPMAHGDHVYLANFSPDGQRIVTASLDNTACIWNARTGQPTAPRLQHARTVQMASFSPDGRRVLSASSDQTARVWDARTGQAVTPPLKHDSTVTCARFSPDGKRVLTSDWNGRARLWDANTGLPISEWIETGGRISDARFDPTGGRIAIASDGVRLMEFPLPPTPVPDWFPPFAEAVAGIRLTPRGNLEVVPRAELQGLMQRLRSSGANRFYEAAAEWFLADPAQRAAEPWPGAEPVAAN